MSAIYQTNSRGSTFISIMLFGFILFVISAGFLLMTTSEHKLNRRSYDNAVAINLAEAGVDYAIWAINLPGTDPQDISAWAGASSLRTKTVPSFQSASGQVMGDFYVEVADSTGKNPLVTSTGYVPGASSPGNIHRTVKVKLSTTEYRPFNGVFFGNDYVHLHGTTSTDSYLGGATGRSNGDIGTFGTIAAAINLTGSAVVNGNARTGPGGTVDGSSAVTGEITHDQVPSSDPPLPPVTVPSELVSLSYGVNGQFTDGLLTKTGSNSAAIPSGNWKLKRIKLTASATLTITGPAKIYLTGDTGDSIAQSGAGSQIICDGKVEFYVDQKVTSSGQGMINPGQNPADLTVWGTPTCTSIKMSGGSTLYAAVYAPSATIDPSGGGDRYGAFVGKEVNCTGNGVYHYDEALAEFGTGGSSGYEPSYWQEK